MLFGKKNKTKKTLKKNIVSNIINIVSNIIFNETLKLNFVIPLLYIRSRLNCTNNIWILSFLIFNISSYLLKTFFSSIDILKSVYNNVNDIYNLTIIIGYFSLLRKDRCKINDGFTFTIFSPFLFFLLFF